MVFTLAILWHERRRFLPAVLAGAFSALLAALQCGLLLGTFATVSIPVDYSDADLWIGCPDVVSVDLGRPVPLNWRSRLCLPEIVQSEEYVQAFAYRRKPSGAAQLVLVIGSRLHEKALGRVQALDGILAQRLQEPGTVVVDEADLGRLEIAGTGTRTEVNGQAVKVVGLVQGLKGLPGPYLFCSLETARALLRMRRDIALRWAGGVPAHKARLRSQRMLGLLGLGAKMDLRPAEMSGGEKQRVAVGRALVKAPALCFADEPTSALDWSNGEGVAALLRAAAHDNGAAVLVVSHDPRLAAFADRVLHLEAGRLTEPKAEARETQPSLPLRAQKGFVKWR